MQRGTSTRRPSRRAALIAGAAGILSRVVNVQAAVADGLYARAAAKGLFFGSALEAGPLASDPGYRQLLAAEAGWVVPADAMKWGQTEGRRGAQIYDRAERIVGFARENNRSIRGHTAIWHRNVPAWVPDALKGPDGMGTLVEHVRQLVAHFRGRVQQWDVVNEAIEPADGLPDMLRNSVFAQTLGPDYIVQAFRAARAAAPDAKLFYNDYDLEYDTDYQDRKRDAVFNLVSRLARERLIDGLGVQSHLKVGNRFNARKFGAFLRDVAELRVAIVTTEFDVNDTRLPADLPTRDAKIVAHATDYLDVMLDEPAVKGLMVWGITSRYTWLNVAPVQRSDLLASRGLAYDSNLQPTPLRQAIASSFDRTRPRSPI